MASLGKWRPPILFVALVIGALALAACGGSNDGTGSGTASTEESGDTSGSETGTLVPEPPLEEPTEIEITEPLNQDPPKLKIAWLACQLPICQQGLTKGNFEAGEALGWEVEQINYDSGKPETIPKAFEQAFANNVDGITITGIPPVLFEQQAKEAVKKGIMIASCSDTTPPEPEVNGLVYQCGDGKAVAKQGEELMSYAINQTDGKANVVAVTIEEYAVLTAEVEGLEKKAAECAECSVTPLPITINELGEGKVPSKLTAYLQQNPETNTIVFTFSDIATGAYDVLASAGLTDGKLMLGAAAGTGTLTEITEGKQDAWTIQPQEMMMWMAYDVMARLETGTPLEPYEESGAFPTWTAAGKETAQQLLDDWGGEWPGPRGFEEKFEELWGV